MAGLLGNLSTCIANSQCSLRSAMDQRHINYDMSFENQHEAVIANVIKKVTLP